MSDISEVIKLPCNWCNKLVHAYLSTYKHGLFYHRKCAAECHKADL